MLPAEPFIRSQGTLNKVNDAVLQFDGCCTNVVCMDFIKRNGSRFEVHPCQIKVVYSRKDLSETALQIVVKAALRLGSHEYVSDWAIFDSRHGVLLGLR